MVDATTNQFQDLMWLKKYNLVSLSQLNTVNNTDTAIDLNLNIYHLIRSALQHGSNMWQIFSNQQRPIQWRQGNLKNESDTRCKSNNQKWFDHRFNDSIQMTQWPVHIKLILLLTKIITDVLSYCQRAIWAKTLGWRGRSRIEPRKTGQKAEKFSIELKKV